MRCRRRYGKLWNVGLNNGWKMIVSEAAPYVIELRIRVADADRVWLFEGLALLADAATGCPLER